MRYELLLVDGHGEAVTAQLRIRTLREFPGLDGLSVHFRPIRNDLLFDSARAGGHLAYRILAGEGIVRSQVWVEYELLGEHLNVMGRSSDLLFALALITAKWIRPSERYQAVAATGVLDADGTVQSVECTTGKLAAAVQALKDTSSAVIFFPAADASAVAVWQTTLSIPGHVELRPVNHLEEALSCLGYAPQKVYLRNPFRGLEHFEYEHHAIFFGRDREVSEAVQQLLRREAAGIPGLLIEGVSGSGKSSFVRAGLLPALVELRSAPEAAMDAIRRRPLSSQAPRALWQPGRAGTAFDEQKLAASIRDCWAALPEFDTAALEGVFPSLAELAYRRRALWPESRRFVWVIDQFEELFTLGLEDPLIDAFGQFLGQLQADGVWTLAAIRTDALPQLKNQASLRAVFGANEGQYYLAALGRTALDDVIHLPARAADLTFGRGPDGKPLDQLLREAAYEEKESLPLLQFTLNELYQRRSGRELTYASYEQLGGLAGSIATTAERLLVAEGADSQRAASRLFRSLVTVDDAGGVTRRHAPMADIIGDPAQKRLLSRLIEARLCVTDQRDGQAVVAFAHDTLLQTLPALTQWLQSEAGLLQTRELAQREAQLWQKHGESDAWLAAADKVVAFKALEAAEVVMPAAVRVFIDRSAQRVRRTRRFRQAVTAIIAVLGIGLIIGAIAFGFQRQRTLDARESAARHRDFLSRLIDAADPRLGERNVTVAQLMDIAPEQIEPLAAKEPLVAASMLGTIAETDRGLGRYPQGLDANARELQLLRTHGASGIDLAAALLQRGELLNKSERQHEAQSVLLEALALVEHRRGAEQQLGNVLTELGVALADSGSEAQAEAMYRRAIDTFRALGDQLSGAFPLADLGALRYTQGRYSEASDNLRQALAIEQQYLPADNPDLLDAESNAAAIWKRSRRSTTWHAIYILSDGIRRPPPSPCPQPGPRPESLERTTSSLGRPGHSMVSRPASLAMAGRDWRPCARSPSWSATAPSPSSDSR
jgi:tetratricopeptide (TPR) repeat protein